MIMTLLELLEGKAGSIVDLSHVDETLKHRLLHVGVFEGCPIKLKCLMPFGGPCMVECQGQLLGIRRCDAEKIKVDCRS
jgi:ferrous iron transport protein A